MKKPQVSELTLREKVAQILMIKQGALLERKEHVEARPQWELAELMEKYQFGSLYSYGNVDMRNFNEGNFTFGVKQKADEHLEFVKFFNDHVRIPVILARGCETGAGNTIEEGTVTPTSLSIGAADDEELTYELSKCIGLEMKACGVDWTWSPVVDVINRFAWMGPGRGYSDNIDVIKRHTIACVKGFQSVGFAAGCKHYPGADTYDPRDSHIAPTVIDITLEEWWAKQAQSFQAAIDAGVYTIMGTHKSWPAVDDEMVNGRYIPCTCSKKIMTDILRDQMGFKGVMITDSINMTSLAAQFERKDILCRSINAGNDMICAAILSDFDDLYDAINEGLVPMERVDEACQRVLDLKEKVGLFDDEIERPKLEEVAPKTRKVATEIVEKSITLVRDTNNIIPLDDKKVKKMLLIISTHVQNPVALMQPMIDAIKARGIDLEVMVDLASADELREQAEKQDIILYAGYIGPHNPTGMPSLYGEKMATYHSAFSSGAEKSVCVSLGNPFLGNNAMAGSNTYFNTYSADTASQEAFVKVLFGDIPYTTYSPVDMEMKRRLIYG